MYSHSQTHAHGLPSRLAIVFGDPLGREAGEDGAWRHPNSKPKRLTPSSESRVRSTDAEAEATTGIIGTSEESAQFRPSLRTYPHSSVQSEREECPFPGTFPGIRQIMLLLLTEEREKGNEWMPAVAASRSTLQFFTRAKTGSSEPTDTTSRTYRSSHTQTSLSCHFHPFPKQASFPRPVLFNA